MYQWQASEFKISSLGKVESAMLKPAANQILVKVAAVSLNYRDKFELEGEFRAYRWLPMVPASDAAGSVVAAGSGVERFKVGDRVISTFAPQWLSGMYRDEKASAILGGSLPLVLAEYIH